ncbi:FkbM family methyltransferase [Aliterella atlantica]|uniref:Methyltransferase, FkbM family domain protein n=1 Tax=Aliterella atlantica CENA595 TaxID=1618023 RepID=A0A0D8ZSV7_9CYAN|nr:FkbM family methyltransferase [Aliterella atlantica]KJH71843.1 methyltransferase, FkbM family domain protein [Aliterella atlantica CENA595]
MIKDTVKKILNSLGFDVRKYNPQASESSRLNHFFTYYNVDLVLDVGANVGQYAKFIRKIGYSGKIVSFEPLSSAYSQLQLISSKDPCWEIAPRAAIGSYEGDITINISANSQSSSVLDILESHLNAAPESRYCDTETVRLTKLDTIAQQYITQGTKSAFLKIDVQGFEKQVIEGASQILSTIHGIQIELSLVPLYQGQLIFSEMLKFMEEIGYELHAVIPGFTDLKTGRLLQMDGIFFRK